MAEEQQPEESPVTTPSTAVVDRQGLSLVTIAVILLVTAGIIVIFLSGVRIIRGDPEPESQQIIALAQDAVMTFESVHGFPPLSVEHPLAASAVCDGGSLDAPHPFGEVLRARFVRAGSHGFRRGAPVASEGVPLVAEDPSLVAPIDRSRLLLTDDLFVGYRRPGDAPHLFGLSRERLRILGASVDWITDPRVGPVLKPRGPNAAALKAAARRARATAEADDNTGSPPAAKPVTKGMADPKPMAADPDPDRDPDPGPDSDSDSDSPSIPNNLKPLIADTLEALSDAMLRTALATCLPELEALSALVSSPAPDRAVWLASSPATETKTPDWLDVAAPVTGAYDGAHRVWIDPEEEASWQSGMLKLGESWHHYRIRGTSLADSFGTEILYHLDAQQRPVFECAGLDRCFVIHPGDNGIIDTRIQDWDGTPMTLGGDDRDGAEDNHVSPARVGR